MIYEVRYEFQAEDEGELSCAAHDVVVFVEDPNTDPSSGWTLVRKESTGEEGYVPTEFLEAVQEHTTMDNTIPEPAKTAPKTIYAPVPSSSGNMETRATLSASEMAYSQETGAATRRLKTTSIIAQKLAKLKVAAKNSMKKKGTLSGATPMGAPRAPALSLAADKENLSEVLSLLNDYFTKVENFHVSTMGNFESSLDSFGVKLNDSAEKSVELVQHLATLEEIIESELSKWKQMNEAERAADLVQMTRDMSASAN